ncbi:MAG: hypothetical protein Q6353_009900 [Candidatus Sigynarchaeum springense]
MMTTEILIDLMIIGLIVLIILALHVFVPKRFKIHMNGIVTFVVLTLLLITITNTTVQIFLILFVAGNMVYIVFYLGIYTTCIDQAREEGITNEDYIKDFNIPMKKEDGHERGYLLKTSKNRGDTDA